MTSAILTSPLDVVNKSVNRFIFIILRLRMHSWCFVLLKPLVETSAGILSVLVYIRSNNALFAYLERSSALRQCVCSWAVVPAFRYLYYTLVMVEYAPFQHNISRKYIICLIASEKPCARLLLSTTQLFVVYVFSSWLGHPLR